MSKKRLLFTALTAAVCLTVSIPLGFIVGVIVIIPTNVTTGLIAGVLTSLVFTSWATFASYRWNMGIDHGDAATA